MLCKNAARHIVDYKRYFPSGTSGVVVLTSRNVKCRQHSTQHLALDNLSESAAQELLLTAAHIPDDQHHKIEKDAMTVANLLQSHPLAIIQAGAYVSRGHCTLTDYPHVYRRQRQRLSTFRPKQAQSRYGDVYATYRFDGKSFDYCVSQIMAIFASAQKIEKAPGDPMLTTDAAGESLQRRTGCPYR